MKRKSAEANDVQSKRSRGLKDQDETMPNYTSGKVERIFLKNFMCHDALEVILNKNVNFIVGRNGSGKSAILTGLTIALGARANVTNRGTSVKEFIKKGKHSALIEVTLVNKGPKAFKKNVYGDKIIISRSIGARNMYKIKNCKGEIIATKRKDLDDILDSMNIQVDNPICILNQDVSRTFLISSNPEEKYDLFMRATLLNKIENEYIEADRDCHESMSKLHEVKETLSNSEKEINKLRRKVRKLEEINEPKKKLEQIEMELQWAVATSEESKLKLRQQELDKCKDDVKHVEEVESQMESMNEEINKKIEKLQEEIRQAKQEATDNTEGYETAQQKYIAVKETYDNKVWEYRMHCSKMKRIEDNINLLRTEIQRLDGEGQSKKNEMRQRLASLEHKLDEVEAILCTKRTDKIHFETDSLRLAQEAKTNRLEMDASDAQIRNIQRELNALQQQSDNAFTVFGPNIPRLLKRIGEEHRKGKFKEKPIGPIGAYIKVKDPAWAPAIEDYLGANTIRTFCVDNSHDLKIINGIMKEVFLNDIPPNIVCSKFYKKIHDVSQGKTSATGYLNLLDAIIISDPVVANCLIDQREIECVLLIPTSQEASQMMSDQHRVPRNCKKALTQQGDEFFPHPGYRSYGGKRDLRAKFIQVSTTEAIQALRDELRTSTNENAKINKTYTEKCEKLQRTKSQLKTITNEIIRLCEQQNNLKFTINNLKDEIAITETISVTEFRNEMVDLEKRLDSEKNEEIRLNNEVKEHKTKLESSEAEVKHYRDIRYGLSMKIDPLKDEINRLQDKKQTIHLKELYASEKVIKIKQALQNATAEFEKQARVTAKVISDAEKKCARINTKRSVNEIKNLRDELKLVIAEIERELGSNEELFEELQEKDAKRENVVKLVSNLSELTDKHYVRVKHRKEMFEQMKKRMGIEIKNAFSRILTLRSYTGAINIDHAKKSLELRVHPQSSGKNVTNDNKSLSGGERSYSTVAFILALWECVKLPFYFLDEFDVFMDKVNRRVIMDILLEHAKSHEEHQFTFLTPLDTSSITANDYITIHQLEAPR